MSLGNADEDTALFVLETRDGERAAELLREQEVGRVAVDGDTVLFADAFDENADSSTRRSRATRRARGSIPPRSPARWATRPTTTRSSSSTRRRT